MVDDDGVIDGNFNTGHDYGNSDLTEEDRYAIIAYLKSSQFEKCFPGGC